MDMLKNSPGALLTSVVTNEDKSEILKSSDLSFIILELRSLFKRLHFSEEKRTGYLYRIMLCLTEENRMEIEKAYYSFGCNNIIAESAIGFFIPKINVKDPILKGMEPSTIVTLQDKCRDGIYSSLKASGEIGCRYHQDAEILKFPIDDNRFEKFVDENFKDYEKAIGTLSSEEIIPTYEVTIDLKEVFDFYPELFNEKNELIKLGVYIRVISTLARYGYGATTWPTAGNKFSTIFIRDWDGKRRDFGEWYSSLGFIINRFSERIAGHIGRSSRRGSALTGLDSKGEYTGFKKFKQLLLIPQSKPGILKGNTLTNSQLREGYLSRYYSDKIGGIFL